MKPRMKQSTSRRYERRQRTGSTALLFLPALLQLFPLAYVVTLSLKSKAEIFRYPPTFLPEGLELSNYSEALASAPLGRFLLNSLFISGAITLLQIVTSLLAAYALARLEFRGKKIVFALIIATMLVPGEVTILPNYLTIAHLDWIDRYAGLIMPFSASGFGVFLLHQFIREIPKELEEAARMDGCSRLRFLFQFVVPLSWPAITAFAIYAFVNAWNQYLWPLIVTQSTEMQTVQIGIGMFRSQNESLSWGVIMAATVILASPTLVLFVLAQRHFIRGMTMSGLKG